MLAVGGAVLLLFLTETKLRLVVAAALCESALGLHFKMYEFFLKLSAEFAAANSCICLNITVINLHKIT